MSSLWAITLEQEAELLQHLRTALSIQTAKKLPIWPVEFIKKHNFPADLMERELKILEIDTAYVLKKIHEHNPRMIFHWPVEDTRYDFPPGHLPMIEETMRIRRKTDTYVLTIKRKNISDDIKEREEFEVTLNNPKQFEEMFMAIWLVPVHVKKKVRYSFEIENVTLDLDLYYAIPPLLEIEWATKDIIRDWINKLGLEKHKVVNWSARQTLLYYGQW